MEHALAPLVYIGPAEGRPLDTWRLKPAGQILDLKVCDFACGSAAKQKEESVSSTSLPSLTVW
jgi:hypothetical protein